MRNRSLKLGLGVILACLAMASGCEGPGSLEAQVDQAYQTSTITALLAGDYDGDLTCGELLTHGDFGLGTFEGLDGEMIVLDGVVYRAKLDGTIEVVDASEETPFAVVTFFEGKQFVSVSQKPFGLDDLEELLAPATFDPQKPFAFRIEGKFDSLLTRSVPKQTEPYPPLTEAIKHQQERTHTNIEGTIVGFYFPQWAAGANVAGYHFHFISADKTVGGHVLAMDGKFLAVYVDACDSLLIEPLTNATTPPEVIHQLEVLKDIESR